MKETYLRPKITDASVTNSDDLFPVALAAAVGKVVRKVLGGEFSPTGSSGLVKRKEYKD